MQNLDPETRAFYEALRRGLMVILAYLNKRLGYPSH